MRKYLSLLLLIALTEIVSVVQAQDPAFAPLTTDPSTEVFLEPPTEVAVDPVLEAPLTEPASQIDPALETPVSEVDDLEIETLIDDPAGTPSTEQPMLEGFVNTPEDPIQAAPPPRLLAAPPPPLEVAPPPRLVERVCCSCFYASPRGLGFIRPNDAFDRRCEYLARDATLWGDKKCEVMKAFPIGMQDNPFTASASWFSDKGCTVNRIALLAHGNKDLLSTYATPIRQCMTPSFASCDARLASCSLFKEPKSVCSLVNEIQKELKKGSCSSTVTITGYRDDSYMAVNVKKLNFDCLYGFETAFPRNEELARKVVISCDSYEIHFRRRDPVTFKWQWVKYTKDQACEYAAGKDPIAIGQEFNAFLQRLINDIAREIPLIPPIP